MAQEPLEDFSEPDPSQDEAEQHRPDWLVGAEEGVEAELERDKGGEGPAFQLRRPDITELPERLARREALASPEPKPAPPVRWTGAASSVPRLHEVSAASPPAPTPARSAAQTPAPVSAPVHRTSRIEEEEEEDAPAEAFDQGFLDAPKGAERSPAARPAYRPPPVREAFWVVWVDMLASDRRVQTLLGLVVVLILVLIFWPRGGGGGVSISAIKGHPGAYEGRPVRVSGRIGEVFVIGQGYVFNLHQGRDTLVVFTRLRYPRSRERTSVVGSVSTGYLDGVARVALFETEAP